MSEGTKDDWSDLMFPQNPILEAKIVGDNVPHERYSAQPEGVTRGHPEYVMSGQDLGEFAHCPHRWFVGVEEEDTVATDFGAIVDCLMMNNELDPARFVVLPAEYTSDKGEIKPWNFNAKVCKEWRESNNPDELLTEVKSEVFAQAIDAVRLLMADPQIAEIFRQSRKQVMLQGWYDDKETGLRIPLKALLDLAPPADCLADLKTTRSAHHRSWSKSVNQFEYHVQAARHLDLWNAATGERRTEFRHIIQENYKPFEIGKRILSAEFISLGRQRYVRTLQRYAQCLKKQEFPGYDETGNAQDLVIDGWLVTAPEAWMVGG